MPLKLKRRPGRPNWYIHGTIRGVTVRESTGVAEQKAAEAIRARREWEIIQRSVFGAEATATFIGAAVSYLEAGGERTYLKPIIAKIGAMPLAKIDQVMIERTARALYPDASPATLNRQAFTPIAAVLNHAAKRGFCARRIIERPIQPKARVRWLTFEEAERLIDACSIHLRPLVVFLFGTGARLSEALYLDWRESISKPRMSRFSIRRTVNTEAFRFMIECWLHCADCGTSKGPYSARIQAAPMPKKRAAGARSRPHSKARVGGPE